MRDLDIESWRAKMSAPNRWMSEDSYVSWVCRYKGVAVMVSKMRDHVSIGIGTHIKIVDFKENRTPDALMNLLQEEVPAMLVRMIQES